MLGTVCSYIFADKFKTKSGYAHCCIIDVYASFVVDDEKYPILNKIQLMNSRCDVKIALITSFLYRQSINISTWSAKNVAKSYFPFITSITKVFKVA